MSVGHRNIPEKTHCIIHGIKKKQTGEECKINYYKKKIDYGNLEIKRTKSISILIGKFNSLRRTKKYIKDA